MYTKFKSNLKLPLSTFVKNSFIINRTCQRKTVSGHSHCMIQTQISYVDEEGPSHSNDLHVCLVHDSLLHRQFCLSQIPSQTPHTLLFVLQTSAALGGYAQVITFKTTHFVIINLLFSLPLVVILLRAQILDGHILNDRYRINRNKAFHQQGEF